MRKTTTYFEVWCINDTGAEQCIGAYDSHDYALRVADRYDWAYVVPQRGYPVNVK